MTLDSLQRMARVLRVPLRNATPDDAWFLDNLVYGIGQELAAAELRVDELRDLRALALDRWEKLT